MVDFRYLEQGIRVGGQWFPVVKMRWVEGFTLNALLREYMDRPQVLQRLAQMWVPLAQKLRRARIAHADLQHGNVLLVPSQKAATVDLRLIDYDGMFVPTLAATPSGEVGHPNYQHPQRLSAGTYDPEVDRFAHLVIYTALRCLPVGGKALWQKHDNAENLLFREQDFKEPASSQLFAELWGLDDADTRALVGHLLLASQAPLERVPLLEDLVDSGNVLPLTPRQLTRVRALLPGGGQAGPVPVEVVPALPSEKKPASGEPSSQATVIETGARKQTAVSVAPQPVPVEIVPAAGPGKLSSPPPLPVTPSAAGPRPRRRSGLKKPGAARRRDADDDSRGLSLAARRRLITLVIGGGLALCGLIVILALTLSGPDELPPNPPPPGGPPPAPKALALKFDPIPPVTLRAGEVVKLPVRLAVDGPVGVVTLQAEDLPARVRQEQPVSLKPGERDAILELRAELAAPEAERQIRIVARAEKEKLEKAEPVSLTVARQTTVDWLPAPTVVLRPGGQKTVSLRLQPAGHDVPLDLVLKGLPNKVTLAGALKPLAPRQAAAELTFAAAPDAPPGTHEAVVALQTAGTRLLEQVITIRVEKPALTLKPVSPLNVRAGVPRRFTVVVERQACEGPVTVEAWLVPAQIRERLVIPAGTDQGTMSLLVGANESVSQELTLTARLGSLEHSRTVRVTVVGTAAAKPAPQPGVGQAVQFTSVDGVTLHGTFYPSTRGRDAPCVLLLPALGEDSGAAPWVSLAGELQRAGCAVLRFDYRGQGRSTSVNPGPFWAQQTNKLGVPGYKPNRLPERIAFNRFVRGYHPVLANDIAAAKAFLDRQSEKGLCNPTNLVLIGARDGATLGALWLNAEHHRYRMSRAGAGATPAASPEGRYVTAVVWLSPQALLGQRPVSLPGLLEAPARQSRLPITVLYGENDAAGKKVANACRSVLTRKKVGGVVTTTGIPGTTALGSALLAESPDTVRGIAQLVAQATGGRGAERVPEQGNIYMWIYSRVPLTQEPARNAGDPMVRYQDFGRFLR
jgi:hypothetical protein